MLWLPAGKSQPTHSPAACKFVRSYFFFLRAESNSRNPATHVPQESALRGRLKSTKAGSVSLSPGEVSCVLYHLHHAHGDSVRSLGLLGEVMESFAPFPFLFPPFKQNEAGKREEL